MTQKNIPTPRLGRRKAARMQRHLLFAAISTGLLLVSAAQAADQISAVQWRPKGEPSANLDLVREAATAAWLETPSVAVPGNVLAPATDKSFEEPEQLDKKGITLQAAGDKEVFELRPTDLGLHTKATMSLGDPVMEEKWRAASQFSEPTFFHAHRR